jgi:hypothetical protein
MATPNSQGKPKFRGIGKGFCGSVWVADRDGESCAIKPADGSPSRSLSNDFDMYRIVLDAVGTMSPVIAPHVQIP